MAELPNLVTDLALILVVAGCVTLLFKKLKQPLVLGYIVVGFTESGLAGFVTTAAVLVALVFIVKKR